MNALALAHRRGSIRRGLSLVAALATGLAVYSYVSWLRSQVPVAGRMVPLIVAAVDLQPGDVITSGMVRLVSHPERYLPPGALRSQAGAVGRVAAVPIYAGEPITARRVGRPGRAIPPGSRAYTFVAALGFAPKAGDRVDVIGTFPRDVLGDAASMTVLRQKEVIAVRRASGASGKLFGAGEQTSSGLGITLLVNPEEAERLALAEALGRITVVLAPQRPDTEPEPAPVRAGDLGAR